MHDMVIRGYWGRRAPSRWWSNHVLSVLHRCSWPYWPYKVQLQLPGEEERFVFDCLTSHLRKNTKVLCTLIGRKCCLADEIASEDHEPLSVWDVKRGPMSWGVSGATFLGILDDKKKVASTYAKWQALQLNALTYEVTSNLRTSSCSSVDSWNTLLLLKIDFISPRYSQSTKYLSVPQHVSMYFSFSTPKSCRWWRPSSSVSDWSFPPKRY